MTKYLVIHNKHEGCYDFQFFQDEEARIRLTSITINPPKVFMFDSKEEAQDFFEEYINDIDCIDIRCKKGYDVEHIEYCTCGVVELDKNDNPVLFYNRKNQIFLLENSPNMFMPSFEVKNDINNLNMTNRVIRKCKKLSKEQRDRYIELGKYCEECNNSSKTSVVDYDEVDENKIISSNQKMVTKNSTNQFNTIIQEMKKQEDIQINDNEHEKAVDDDDDDEDTKLYNELLEEKRQIEVEMERRELEKKNKEETNEEKKTKRTKKQTDIKDNATEPSKKKTSRRKKPETEKTEKHD